MIVTRDDIDQTTDLTISLTTREAIDIRTSLAVVAGIGCEGLAGQTPRERYAYLAIMNALTEMTDRIEGHKRTRSSKYTF